jgi:hypothetical protein
MRRSTISLLALAIVTPAVFGAPCDAPDSTACTEQVRLLDARVHSLIGAARCTQDTDCRTTALGSKPCGGPASYLAYSIVGLDGAALEAAVAALNGLYRLRTEALNRAGVMSDCAIITDPGAVCDQERCELRAPR